MRKLLGLLLFLTIGFSQAPVTTANLPYYIGELYFIRTHIDSVLTADSTVMYIEGYITSAVLDTTNLVYKDETEAILGNWTFNGRNVYSDLNTFNDTVHINNIQIEGNKISTITGTDFLLTPLDGQDLIIDSHWEFDDTEITALTNNNSVLIAYTGKNITIESVTFDGGIVNGVTDLTISGTFTDGTFSSTAGAFIGIVSLSDGIASWTSSSLNGFVNITATGTIQAEQLTSTDDALIKDDLTLGDDNANFSGTINWIASDNDQGKTEINTSDQLVFSGFSGGVDIDGDATVGTLASDASISSLTLAISDSAFIDTLQFSRIYGLDSLNIDSLNFVPDLEFANYKTALDTSNIGYLPQDETVTGDWLFDGIVTISDSAFIDTLQFSRIYGLDSLNIDSLNFVPDLEYTTGIGGKADTALVGYLAQNESITGNWVNTTNPWAENELISTVLVESDLNTFSELQSLVSNKTLINEEDAATIDVAWTFDGVITVSDSAYIDTLTTSISNLGTVKTGAWTGTSIGDAYIDNNITASNYTLLTAVGDTVTTIVDSTYIDGKNFVPDLEFGNHRDNSGTDHSLLGATPGTATASKALIVDASKDITLDGGDLIAAEITGTLEANFTNNAAAITFGAIGTDVDVVLAFDAVGNQGSITYMNTEDRFDFDNDVYLGGNLTLGGTVDGIDIATDVAANTLKDTNVSTELSIGTTNANTVSITSDGGADDVTIPAAINGTAGLLTDAKWDEIVVNNAKNTNVSTALTLDTPTATTVPINSDGSSPDITLIEATTTTAGLLGADKWDEIVASTSILNVTPGTATASKALVVDASKDITLGTGDLTATNLTGTLQTAAQTNITSVGALGGGSITGGFGAIDIGASTYTTTGLIKTDSLKASGNVDIDGEVTLGADARYPIEGYATSRNVDRTMQIDIRDGGTPGTNLACVSNAGHAFNIPTSTNAATLAKSGTEGSWSLSADGLIITLNLTETIIGIKSISIGGNDLADSGGIVYHIPISIVGGNITFELRVAGSMTRVDWTTVTATASDAVVFYVNFITSS